MSIREYKSKIEEAKKYIKLNYTKGQYEVILKLVMKYKLHPNTAETLWYEYIRLSKCNNKKQEEVKI